MTLLFLLDLLLVLLATARLTRLVVGDDLGEWYVRAPAGAWAVRGKTPESRHRRLNYVGGLSCPFCVGFWIGAAVLITLWLAGGPGHAWEPWRWVAGAFAINYVTAHLGARLGDVDS